jgi:hypothetical protein
MPGPVPKRSSERRRRAEPDALKLQTVVTNIAPSIPAALDYWHPLAKEWYEALAVSGQSTFYEASDWAVARITAEAIHRLVTADRFSSNLYGQVLEGCTSLLATEADRRKLRIELVRRNGAVASIDEQARMLKALEGGQR